MKLAILVLVRLYFSEFISIYKLFFDLFLANETSFIRTLKDCSPLEPNDTIVYDNEYTITSEVIRCLK